MNCVKIESYVVEAGTDRSSPLWGGFAGSSNWWWMLMTGVLKRQLLNTTRRRTTQKDYMQHSEHGELEIKNYISL
jgi:hypothetical protein